MSDIEKSGTAFGKAIDDGVRKIVQEELDQRFPPARLAQLDKIGEMTAQLDQLLGFMGASYRDNLVKIEEHAKKTDPGFTLDKPPAKQAGS